MPDDRPEVLFLCIHNAGRSQMAAALLDRYAQGRIVVRSAGTEPADEINPTVMEAMAEVGIDLRPRASSTGQCRGVVIAGNVVRYRLVAVR